jgi:hypothetical protein
MDNTVGSLTQLQRSLIIGSVLGDGYIRIMPGRKDAFLEVNHSLKAKDYVDWKYFVLKNICNSEPKERETNEGRIAYRFFTKQDEEITEIYNLFYQDGKKIIPTELEMNPIVLAVWLMDDGSKSNGGIYLNTQQFSMLDQRRLLHKLREIGLRARLNRDKKYYRIRFLKESIPKLIEIVQPYIIPSMRYKIEL